ncbi:hypothetical protein V8F33_009976 [Rhypophila sp. PSN 637]
MWSTASFLLLTLGTAFAVPTTSLTRRTTVQFQGFFGDTCNLNLINNGPLNSNECFNLAAPTFSYRPSGNSNCVVAAWTSRDCAGEPFISGFATGQCISGILIDPTGQNPVEGFEFLSVKVSC